MKILMTSVFFYPHIGGIETVTENLANEFVRMRHEVIIVTTIKDNSSQSKYFPYTILRSPTKKELYNVYKWCDIYVHQGISLKWIWPIFLKYKPWVIVYHQVHFQKGYRGWLKKACSHFAYNIAVSRTTALGYKLKNVTVIYNSYNNSIFKKTNHSERKDFVFVGAVSRAKGCCVLLDAFEKFKQETDSDYKLTFIGNNKQKKEIEDYARTLSSFKDIEFLGSKYPQEVAEILNQKKIQIVPSVLPEAFGVVVLEGLACGCITIGSDKSGIEEALGGCGLLFKIGDSEDLFQKMLYAYNMSQEDILQQDKKTKEWLNYLSLHNNSKRYIECFEEILNKK